MDDEWALGIPRLTETEARRLRDVILPSVSFGVILVDPQKTLLRGYDESVVKVMVRALAFAHASGMLSTYERLVAQNLLDDYEDWLSFTRASDVS